MLQPTGHSRSMTLPRTLFLCGVFLVVLIICLRAFGSGEDVGDSGASYMTSSLDALRATIPGSNIQKRLRRYEQLWRQSVDMRHDMYRSYADPKKNMYNCINSLIGVAGTEIRHRFPSIDEASYFTSPFTIWDFFPATYNCPHEMERVGRLGDGGKWTCGMSRYSTTSPKSPCIIYSFGVQNESSFEENFLRRTRCSVYGVDYSVVDFGSQLSTLNPSQASRAHFRRVGIAGKTDRSADPPFYSIGDLMRLNGHEYIDVLKMDIEGFEFESMATLMREYENLEKPLPIGQFMVEIHLEDRLTGSTKVDLPYLMKWWERLETLGMRPVWTEPNLLFVTLNAQENAMPRYAEYTFINVRQPRNVLLSD